MATTATAVTALTTPGNRFGGTFTADMPSIAAAGQEIITVTIPGLKTTDVVVVAPQSALLAGLCIDYVQVSAADTLKVAVHNYTGAGVDQASTVFSFQVVRGNTGASFAG
jgi:hypothetical protein